MCIFMYTGINMSIYIYIFTPAPKNHVQKSKGRPRRLPLRNWYLTDTNLFLLTIWSSGNERLNHVE